MTKDLIDEILKDIGLEHIEQAECPPVKPAHHPMSETNVSASTVIIHRSPTRPV